MKLRLLLILLPAFVGNENLCSQHAIRLFFKISRAEKAWVLAHPFAARKALRISQEALGETQKSLTDQRLDGLQNGGQTDAFRHAYWMARLSGGIGARRAESLGRAHEKGNRQDFKKRKLEEGVLPDSVSCKMDLINNKVGISIRKKHPEAGKEELKELIIGEILAGNLVIIYRNREGEYIDCHGKPIDPAAWKGKWNIPKCLVSSARSAP